MRGNRRRQQPQPFIFGVFAAICIGVIWVLSKANSTWFNQYITIILIGVSIIILLFSLLRLIFNKKQGLFGRIICIALIVLSSGYLLWVYMLPLVIQWFRQNIIITAILVIALLLLAWKKGWFLQLSLPRNKPPSKEQLINMGGYGFENYIGGLLKRDGWTIVQAKGGSGDRGLDLIATKTDQDSVQQKRFIQCKNWNYRATPDTVRNLNGAIPAGERLGSIGIVICPSGFTSQAEDEAREYKILTWKYEDICNLWRKVTKSPVPAVSAPPMSPLSSWQEVEYKDLNQWVKNRFANIVIKGKTFAYRINRNTGRFDKKLRRSKDDLWCDVRYEDLSPWAMNQFANMTIRGKMFVYRINRNTGKFEQKLK